jgi:hypothetical protein
MYAPSRMSLNAPRFTPTCAMPLALPPLKATPIFWRSCEYPAGHLIDGAVNRPAARRAIMKNKTGVES